MHDRPLPACFLSRNVKAYLQRGTYYGCACPGFDMEGWKLSLLSKGQTPKFPCSLVRCWILSSFVPCTTYSAAKCLRRERPHLNQRPGELRWWPIRSSLTKMTLLFWVFTNPLAVSYGGTDVALSKAWIQAGTASKLYHDRDLWYCL